MEAKVHDPLLPLWCRTAPQLPEHPGFRSGALPDRIDADTIVIGAGVTGLSTALHLAEAGARVVVFDRQGPGLGSSGRSNGQVIAGLKKDPDAVLAAYGPEQGERMVAFSGKACDLVFELVARHGIECEAERTGWIQSTRSKRELKALATLVDAWSRRGAPVRMLDRAETARLLGTEVYAGAWVDDRNGTIQPLAYTRGLATAAARKGVRLHFDVDVSDVVRRGKEWHIATNRGEARAETVVLATNAYTSELEGVAKTFLGRTFLSAYSVQLATEPLDDALRASILPMRHSCADTEHLGLRYFRLDREGRFIIGGPGWVTPPGSAKALSFRMLEASTRRMFPQLKTTRFEYRWYARDTLTPDLLPHLYEPSPGMFSALGYNGRGLAVGSALGSVLARRVLGEAGPLPYPMTEASVIPLTLPAAAKFYFSQAIARIRRGLR